MVRFPKIYGLTPGFFQLLGRLAVNRHPEDQLSNTSAACFNHSAAFEGAVFSLLSRKLKLTWPAADRGKWLCKTQISVSDSRYDIHLTPLEQSSKNVSPIIFENKVDAPLTEKQLLKYWLERVGLSEESVRIIWEKGDIADKILKVCRREEIDLLIAGALQRENLVQYYIGTIARKIMRKAECSLMMIINPSAASRAIRNVVVNAEDSPYVEEALQAACRLGKSSGYR